MSFPTQHHHFRASTPSTLPATPHVEPDGPYWPPLGAKGRNGEVETGTIGWLVPTAPGRTVLRIPTFRGQTSWKLGREHDSEAVSYANDVVLPGTFISGQHCVFYWEMGATLAETVVRLRDLSVYGTFVNHARITSGNTACLRAGDIVEFSSEAFQYTFYHGSDTPDFIRAMN